MMPNKMGSVGKLNDKPSLPVITSRKLTDKGVKKTVTNINVSIEKKASNRIRITAGRNIK